jgi:cytosine/uracil/thiamine/allantoin permease
MPNTTETSKWNSRKFAALMITLVTNLLLWMNVDDETAQTFSTAAVNAVSLGYIIVQGWVDSRGR